MDEIICPDCGRPNLSEAEKCWYCQVPLVKGTSDAGQKNGTFGSNNDQSAAENQTVKTPLKDDSSEDLPDWLKRIRELKKADQPVEENDQWQQQKLFTGQAEEPEEPSDQPEYLHKISRSHNEQDSKPVIPEGQPLLEEAPAEEEFVNPLEPNDLESNQADDDLPEGFTPL